MTFLLGKQEGEVPLGMQAQGCILWRTGEQSRAERSRVLNEKEKEHSCNRDTQAGLLHKFGKGSEWTEALGNLQP